MADYIGETVLVTLKDPPGTKIRGLVTNIVDYQLCLKDSETITETFKIRTLMLLLVTWLPSQNRMDMFVVDGPGNLLDLEILPPGSRGTSSPAASVQPDIDPAILSYVKSASQSLGQKQSATSKPPTVGSKASGQEKHGTSPQHAASTFTALHEGRDPSNVQQPRHGTSATLTGPFEDLSINGFRGEDEGQIGGKEGTQHNNTPSKWKKTRRGKGRGKDSPAEVAGQTPLGVRPNSKDPSLNFTPTMKQGGRGRGNGWRETPLLEDASRPKSPLLHPRGGSSGRKPSRREIKLRAKMEKSGWATEDATDIQEMGDFDFSGNLSKFDKRGVFDQLKQEDTTADEERLVNFNRIPPRAGTAGGKNLHFTENVLSPKAESRKAWSSHDSEADGEEARFSSGRSSHRNMSRVSTRQPTSRKGSTVTTDQHGTGSGSFPEPKVRARWASRAPSDNLKAARDLSSSRDTAMPHLPSSAQSKPSFRIVSSNQYCPCLTPLQMLELEQLAISELGMSDELMTENASRSIAETASKLIHPMSELSNKNKNGPGPVVVVLAGNTKSGARAIAGARQLRNHGARVMLTLLALEREDDLLDVIRRQLSIYQNSGGQLTKPSGLKRTLRSLRAKPDLIIDALLGMHMSYDDLRTDDQETYFGLANWANNSAHVMAIDVPSGVDASTGTFLLIPS